MLFILCGCKVNQYETNAMIQKFIENGYEVVDFEDVADVYVINTCTVTNISDKKSRQVLRRAKKLNKDAIVVATGCYVQVAKDDIEKMSEIDIVIGTNEKNDIIKYIDKFKQNHLQEDFVGDVMNTKEFVDFGSVDYSEKTRAIIKVQDGCDRFCSYCIIPYARGRVRSRKIESVIEEVKHVVNKGIKEVVITGIHIASYGKDFKEKIGLIDLLTEINKIDGLERIRLGSIEPVLIDEEFMGKYIKLEKMCDHFHLSLQSACNDTLKRMNRRYTIEEFKNIVNLIRKNYSNPALTTDIIVGFPGETDEEFETTFKNLKEINFYKLHIFKYSQRKGTKAAVMENQVSSQIKEERSNILMELTENQKHDFHNKFIGKIEKVLWEQIDGEYIKGHTTNYILVYAKKGNIQENTISNVLIEGEYNDGLIGKVTQM